MNDVGRVVNPLVVQGQLEGGAMQGIGQALCEAMIHDRASGQPLTGSFLDYAMPRADMSPHFAMTTDEATPSINNILGVKGVGELGTIGATPVVVNAVLDAIHRARPDAAADALQMPLTAERVWGALRGAGMGRPGRDGVAPRCSTRPSDAVGRRRTRRKANRPTGSNANPR